MVNKFGFTLIELILVVALILIIATTATFYNSQWYFQNNLDSTKNILISSIHKAQSYSISKKNGLTWGVCLTGQTIRMFGGSCASPTIKDDFILPANISINGLSTITFNPLRGEPNSAQSINLSGNNKTFNLIINSAGGVSVH
ncbi:MAG: prepilin-type N-terminal cleavage/methylation domain-containing protein [Candidatus Shapirobacteria bacterium]|nr:prepilin-type N-terminal cleavage/methylation domain-containing protein [Candidatus Shapirobacteria bacterium]MDD3002799.1 prepilin-type N-terminal cleavage/methylation domain-containing protein [Candidatus Shapirobacteria bacterium]MDD4383527.1 prepilin-type N-terminal cleavage/methylation domain-containing protein [Candidatus Shapirobacteria bacterium]